MSVKENKQESITKILDDLCDFVQCYLPLVNAHNTDFLTHNLWESLVNKQVAADLLELSDQQLAQVPSGKIASLGKCCSGDETNIGGGGTDEKLNGDAVMVGDDVNVTGPDEIHSRECDNADEDRICSSGSTTVSGMNFSGGVFDLDDGKSSKKKNSPTENDPEDIHSSSVSCLTLHELMTTCQRHTLPYMSVLTDLKTLQGNLKVQGAAEEAVKIDHIMSPKKSHEVYVMTQACSQLATHFNIDKVVDIGSGKGYLGCHLALMYNLQVLGIDSSDINTQGADRRRTKLTKHWKGLLRNATAQQNGTYVRKSRSRKAPSNSASDQQDLTPSTCPSNVDSRYVPITHYMTKETDLSRLIAEHFPVPRGNKPKNNPTLNQEHIRTDLSNLELSGQFSCSKHQPTDCVRDCLSSGDHGYLLTGLHTCGNLGTSVLKLFIDHDNIHCVCAVGCCYHLLQEQYNIHPYNIPDDPDKEEFGFPVSRHLHSKKFQLGRNARMLAAQPPERLSHNSQLPSESLFWRALLQVILCDLTGERRPDWQVGRIAARCGNFTEYTHKCLHKLGLSEHYSLSDEQIGEYWSRYESKRRASQAFFQLRALLAPCIEALILLDRLLYLLEQPCVEEAHLVQLFDPVESPRCYGIIAWKSSMQPSQL